MSRASWNRKPVRTLPPDDQRQFVPWTPDPMPLYFRDGEPCPHVGCINHITHPCEFCGRIGARGEVWIPAKTSLSEND